MQYKISEFNNRQVLPELRSKGVYKILAEDGRTYVGSAAICFRARWWEHLDDLKKNIHHCNQLQNIYNKYGENYLSFIILEVVQEKEKILEREQFWLDFLQADLNVWKIVNSPLGYKHTEESVARNKKVNRERASAADKGVKYTKSNNTFSVLIRIDCVQHRVAVSKDYDSALSIRKQAELLFWSDEFDSTPDEEKADIISKFKYDNGLATYSPSRVSKHITEIVDGHYRFTHLKTNHVKYFDTKEEASTYKKEYLDSLRVPRKLAKSGHRYIKMNKYGTYMFTYKPVRHIKSFKTLEEAIIYRDNFLASDNKDLSPRRIASTGHKFIYFYKEDKFKFTYHPHTHSRVFPTLEEAVAYKTKYLANLNSATEN